MFRQAICLFCHFQILTDKHVMKVKNLGPFLRFLKLEFLGVVLILELEQQCN